MISPVTFEGEHGKEIMSLIPARIMDIIYQGPKAHARKGEMIEFCQKYYYVKDNTLHVLMYHTVPLKGDSYYLVYAKKSADPASAGYGLYRYQMMQGAYNKRR
ncbi:MAG TPA: hypothetical protein PLZ84_02485 [Clostridia bacterium]|nr:hypothetical protein [Clostridia bacterium]